MDERQRARLHEAGHSIVAHVLGMESSGVVVFSGDEAHVGHYLPTGREVDAMTRADFEAFTERVALVDLAGAAALEVFGDARPWHGADQDRAQARTAAPTADPDALYRRAVALIRQHRAAVERFAATLAANHDRIAGGHDARIAAEAALGGWPTPRLDDARSELDVAGRRRALFEEHLPSLGPDPAWAARWDLWKRAEAAARGGPALRARSKVGTVGPDWTPDERAAAQAAYRTGGVPAVLTAVATFRARRAGRVIRIRS